MGNRYLSTVVQYLVSVVMLAQCVKSPAPKSHNLKNNLSALRIETHHHFPLKPSNPSKMQVVNAFPKLNFKRPIFLLSPPDHSGRIFVVEQDGTIVVFQNSPETDSSSLFLDIRELVARNGEEEGLLGMAFDPDYAHNGYFYLNYTAPSPLRTIIVRYHVSADPNVADPDSEKIMLEIPQPYSNHNGGMVAFGPDGMLYIGMGDGGSGGDPQGNGQNTNTLLGKMLRIDPRGEPYSVPKDNPFANQPLSGRPEIWAYGLRNPWRFSFDQNTGKLWAGDVGQDKYEEIDIIEKDGNYGWNECEGFHRFGQSGTCPTSFQAPIFEYDHHVGQCIIGGYVYRGSKLPSLRGAYLYGDNVSKQLWALVYDGQSVSSNVLLGSLPVPLSSFGVDDQGEVYALGLRQSGAKIYRFQESGNQPPPPLFPTKLSETGLFADTANLKPDPSLVPYDVSVPLWSDGADKNRWITLPLDSKIDFNAQAPWVFPVGTALVKHFEIKTSPGKIRRLETRVLLHEETGWAGYTYKWDEAQKEAHLLLNSQTETYTIEDGHRSHSLTWTYPSRTDCLRCHTAPSGFVLGVNTYQLNHPSPYQPEHQNLLKTWAQLNLFKSPIGDPAKLGSYPSLNDPQSTHESRARAYLAVNCAHCHQKEGGTPATIDLNFNLPLSQTQTIGVTPGSGDLGISDAKIIFKGKKEQSILWERMRLRNEKQMPPLASSVADAEAISFIGNWIDSLK